MEVQISPAPQFNGNSSMIDGSSSPAYGPSAKRFKSDLTFQCIVCSDVHNDPDALYEHMKTKHRELYECAEGSAGENADTDSEHELSDEEYLDLSRLLEPICELKQVDDDDVENEHEQPTNNVNANAANAIAQLFGTQMNEEQLRFQLQLQMQLQSHLLQLQMNQAFPQMNQLAPKTNGKAKKSLALRK